MCSLKQVANVATVDFYGGGRVWWTAAAVLVLVVFCSNHHGSEAAWADKVEYIRLPLLTFDGNSKPLLTTTLSPSSVALVSSGTQVVGQSRSSSSLINSTSINITELLRNLTGGDVSEEVEDEQVEGDEQVEEEEEIEDVTSRASGQDGDGEMRDMEETVGEDEDDDNVQFNELDLIDLVQELEHQADMEEQTGIFPEILDILHGKKENKSSGIFSSTFAPPTTAASAQEGISNITLYKSGVVSRSNGTLRISLNEDGDLELGSEDLSQFTDEIVDGISEGVEESLRMSSSDDDGLEIGDDLINPSNLTAETRQFSVYLFQGQYYAEPRLNRFIDGAIRNMGTELRVASMDPLFFRVLPRGQVVERERPLMAAASANGIRRRRPGGGGAIGGALAVGRHILVKRQAFFKLQPNKKKQQTKRKTRLPVGVKKITSIGGTNIFLSRRRQQQQKLRQRQRRQRLRQQRLKQQLKNKLKKQQQQKNKNKQNNRNKQQQQALLNRIRRRIRQDVGGGRIEGLSRVQRDGDAEMQLFGNYTLIRSHMKMGPIEITMQFRTKNGIRRSGATLPAIRAHTVTRVNHEGSEMIDYLLDRPHPESIHVRGALFPLAQKVARNVFARLFLPNSFLVSRLREKTHLAYLSRPVAGI